MIDDTRRTFIKAKEGDLRQTNGFQTMNVIICFLILASTLSVKASVDESGHHDKGLSVSQKRYKKLIGLRSLNSVPNLSTITSRRNPRRRASSNCRDNANFMSKSGYSCNDILAFRSFITCSMLDIVFGLPFDEMLTVMNGCRRTCDTCNLINFGSSAGSGFIPGSNKNAPKAFSKFSPSDQSIRSPAPSTSPMTTPSYLPTNHPTPIPTNLPTEKPTLSPTINPSSSPIESPSNKPTRSPTFNPTSLPIEPPSNGPIGFPTITPSSNPKQSSSMNPTQTPTTDSTISPTEYPSINPSVKMSVSPTANVSGNPSVNPSVNPYAIPSANPSVKISSKPSINTSASPSVNVSTSPSVNASASPSINVSTSPIVVPSSFHPSITSTTSPVLSPTTYPTSPPSTKSTNRVWLTDNPAPTIQQTDIPSTASPVLSVTANPIPHPSTSLTNRVWLTDNPTTNPTFSPTIAPTIQPMDIPISFPTHSPPATDVFIDTLTRIPSDVPTISQTISPVFSPSAVPQVLTALNPSISPTSLKYGDSQSKICRDDKMFKIRLQSADVSCNWLLKYPETKQLCLLTGFYKGINKIIGRWCPIACGEYGLCDSNGPTQSPTETDCEDREDFETKFYSTSLTCNWIRSSRQKKKFCNRSALYRGNSRRIGDLCPKACEKYGKCYFITSQPSVFPSAQPSNLPSTLPSSFPSMLSSVMPSVQPSFLPSEQVSNLPSVKSFNFRSSQPSQFPIMKFSLYPSVKLSSASPTTVPFFSAPSMISKHTPNIGQPVANSTAPSRDAASLRTSNSLSFLDLFKEEKHTYFILVPLLLAVLSVGVLASIVVRQHRRKNLDTDSIICECLSDRSCTSNFSNSQVDKLVGTFHLVDMKHSTNDGPINKNPLGVNKFRNEKDANSNRAEEKNKSTQLHKTDLKCFQRETITTDRKVSTTLGDERDFSSVFSFIDQVIEEIHYDIEKSSSQDKKNSLSKVNSADEAARTMRTNHNLSSNLHSFSERHSFYENESEDVDCSPRKVDTNSSGLNPNKFFELNPNDTPGLNPNTDDYVIVNDASENKPERKIKPRLFRSSSRLQKKYYSNEAGPLRNKFKKSDGKVTRASGRTSCDQDSDRISEGANSTSNKKYIADKPESPNINQHENIKCHNSCEDNSRYATSKNISFERSEEPTLESLQNILQDKIDAAIKPKTLRKNKKKEKKEKKDANLSRQMDLMRQYGIPDRILHSISSVNDEVAMKNSDSLDSMSCSFSSMSISDDESRTEQMSPVRSVENHIREDAANITSDMELTNRILEKDAGDDMSPLDIKDVTQPTSILKIKKENVHNVSLLEKNSKSVKKKKSSKKTDADLKLSQCCASLKSIKDLHESSLEKNPKSLVKTNLATKIETGEPCASLENVNKLELKDALLEKNISSTHETNLATQIDTPDSKPLSIPQDPSTNNMYQIKKDELSKLFVEKKASSKKHEQNLCAKSKKTVKKVPLPDIRTMSSNYDEIELSIVLNDYEVSDLEKISKSTLRDKPNLQELKHSESSNEKLQYKLISDSSEGKLRYRLTQDNLLNSRRKNT